MAFDGTAIRQWLGFLGRGVESLQKLDSLYSGQEEDDLEETEDSELDDDIKLQSCYKGDKTERLKNTVKTTFCEGEKEFTVYKHRMKHGFYTATDAKDAIKQVGKYRMGQKEGLQWRRLEGSAWLVSTVSKESMCTDDDSPVAGEEKPASSSVFIYPDLVTALVGDMDPDGLALGDLEVADIVGVGAKCGILTPVLRSRGLCIPAPLGTVSDTVLAQSLISDPYESIVSEVRESLIPGAGEGLFTRRSIPAGQLVAYFAGVQVNSDETEDNDFSISSDKKQEGLNTATTTYNSGKVFDIPQRIRSTYCGTLGHKCCHSFQPSAMYSYAVHPRFGRIRAVTALHNLDQGVEITTDYKYQLAKAPTWYKEALSNYLVNTLNMPPEQVEEHIQTLLHKQLKQREMEQISDFVFE